MYLAAIMQVFTHSIRVWHLGWGTDQELTLTALQKALVEHLLEILHSDQSLQYAESLYSAQLSDQGAKICMAEVGGPTQNSHAERRMRTITKEKVDLRDYDDYHDAREQIGQFLEAGYIPKRVRSRLGYLTLAKFERQ